ncbi:GerAB/ArcD/ProY family transporter [Paenibacillus radicis (ex Xue et al. 2023)]|uniref:Endospore germination permease n=1 Tax=Paenibacillus radicis (ex Xue et al. 2023) TaxID=2972489 RepID=A0ABT1YU35_9BACL|nr:endospore germination permease [Paenibacillus radicis (ex Xue et al. 2023)]MCR8636697.1 endospore germination permease [Paenibacillus radicis (ex Xue et al. 2023)]
MDQKQIINYRQFSWLTASLLTGGGLVSIQQVLLRVNSMDAWMSYTLPTFYVIALCYIFSQMVRRFPGKNLFEITKIVFGGMIGTIVNLVLLLHLWLILVRDLSSVGMFVGITLLPETPEEIIIMLFTLLLLYYGKTSVEVLARVNDLMFPLFFLLILSSLMLTNEIDGFLLLPTMAGTIKNFLASNTLSLGWYGDIFIMGAFLHTLWESKQVHSAMRHGVFLASLLLITFLVLEVLVLGPNMAGNFLYPNYNLVQQIHITDFLDRMDLIILSIWFPVTACEVILIYLAFITGIASLVKQRDYSSINTPVVLLLLLTTLLSFKGTSEVFSFGNYSSPIIVLSYQPVLFLLLWLFAFRHPVKSQINSPMQDSSKQKDQSQLSETDGKGDTTDRKETSDKSQSRSKRKRTSNGQPNPAPAVFHPFTLRTWQLSSNLLLLISLISVCVGLWMSKHHSSIGVICGFTYGFCTIVVVLSSYMELFTAKQHRKG